MQLYANSRLAPYLCLIEQSLSMAVFIAPLGRTNINTIRYFYAEDEVEAANVACGLKSK